MNTELNTILLSAYEHMEHMVLITNSKGIIVYANNAICNLYGYTKDELIGASSDLFDAKLYPPQYLESIKTTLSKGETWKGELINRTKNGDLRWEKATITPISINGEGSYYIAIKEDISCLKQKEEKEKLTNKLYESIVEMMPLMVSRFNEKGDLSFVNKHYATFYGKTKEELIGHSIYDFIDNNRKKKAKADFAKLTRDVPMRDTIHVLPNAKGDIRWIRWIDRLLFDDDTGGKEYQSIGLDVTDVKQAEIKLQIAQEKYQTTLNRMSDMILLLNKDLTIILSNESAKKWSKTALGTSDIEGKYLYHVIPSMPDWIKTMFKKAFVTGETYVLEDSQEISGLSYSFDLKIIPVVANKIVENVILEVKDVTQIKETQQALAKRGRRLQTIIQSSAVGIGLLDTNAKYIFVNKQYEAMTGYSREELVGKSVMSITHPDDLPKSGEYLSQLLSRKINEYHIEKRYINKQGYPFWIDLHVSPILDEHNNIVEVIGIITDISDRKKLQAEQYEKEQALLQLNSTKDKFFSTIAHDLKGPFNAILGFTELLKESVENGNVENSKNYVENLDLCTSRTYGLLDQLLTWSRANSGRLPYKPEPLNLKSEVDLALVLMQEVARAKSIAITNLVDKDIRVMADSEMLATILRNMISNAIKYSFPKGKINIGTTSVDIEEGYIGVYIQDFGIGMGQETISTLFKTGKGKTQIGTANELGTGLGLVIVDEFVNAHGGKIHISSEEGTGSTFVFTLQKP